MTQGRVYVWEPCEDEFAGGRLRLDTVPLTHLNAAPAGQTRLAGRFVDVVNGARIVEPGGSETSPACTAIGNARPDDQGNFFWDPAAGGGRRAKTGARLSLDPAACVQASHFGEVNAYHHITRMAQRIDALLSRLGEKPLPRVRVVVNAHRVPDGPADARDVARDADGTPWEPLRTSRYLCHAATDQRHGKGPAVRCSGEIQLAPGTRMTKEGWLPRLAGTRYRTTAAHIAGHLYRQYGFHVSRHTADFVANSLQRPSRQNNAKTATASAISDYWAASMLATPHVWCWHHRHDGHVIHPRSLASATTMADLAAMKNPSARDSATVLAAALWDLKGLLDRDGDADGDLLVLAALLTVRRLWDDPYRPDRANTRRLRDGFAVFAACLLHADALRFDGRHADRIATAMRGRGIDICDETVTRLSQPSVPPSAVSTIDAASLARHTEKIRTRFAEAIVPVDDDLMHPDALEVRLRDRGTVHWDLAAVGDVMTGMRMRHRIRRFGPRYVCAWVKPILDRAAVTVGNQEGPFADEAEQQDTTRNFSYKVDPRSAVALRHAGFHALSIANNHIMDCGRDGVRETLATLDRHGIAAIGGGLDEATAHDPAVFETRGGRVGLLGYYWNRRTSARGNLPGSARDLPELVERDIARLKRHVDRVAVTVHWGVPYEREPLAEDRAKARHFIDCGADIVIGHHPHIIQPFEIHRGRPIFYSVGNFAFGSGNSRAESLLVCVRFADDGMDVEVFPIYVQNRDPRLDYQPKVLRGAAAAQTLSRLASISGADGQRLVMHDFHASLHTELSPLPAQVRTAKSSSSVSARSSTETVAT